MTQPTPLKTFEILLLIAVVIGGGWWLAHRETAIDNGSLLVEETATPTPEAVDTSNWETYRNEILGVSFKYPSGWTVRTDTYCSPPENPPCAVVGFYVHRADNEDVGFGAGGHQSAGYRCEDPRLSSKQNHCVNIDGNMDTMMTYNGNDSETISIYYGVAASLRTF
ncbi:MAG: hypothetical protein AAB483_04015 [Patescibacteria group bacterium]